ncbi:putative transporter [Campylobacter sputorum subsp. bubulus]|uniref:Putative transporter n=1 Tax=Campylobacter sputorum subsp. sputorum TaxID=32024 RepID=A0A381DJ40_9BACT|nr:putative transporter [Campylobacter sputorum]ASM35718.1 long-chain fatty acid ABC transporter, fused permease and ATPase components, SbmA family [Campylobacter sputorum aubsp. sputorum RM3237]ASM39100.1 long-chain fatty acid ABC transporter, fused permease and ATPase components, SbmA family [Campylobacter sputorum bv. paraureolyticus LMG 11764]KAB0580686.1 putative transporter [Campylobacter sputorum subsp. sputorum]MDY6120144.1 putative transporter [Campylobacter sputorum]QEL05908.1 long-c
MFRSFFANKKWLFWSYGGGLLLVILLYAQVQCNVMINEWYKDFYDMMQNISKHTIDEYWAQVRRFLYIAMPYVIIATLTQYFTSIYTFKWREAMTFDYINEWRGIKKDIEGSSQRIQEDIYRFAKIVESLGLIFIKAVMTLIAFLPILWHLSDGLNLPIFGDTKGSLVWLALIVSIGGIVVSWFVGIKLPGLEYNNQKVEAAFRKELVYAEDDKKNYGDISTLTELFTGLRFNYHRLFLHYGYFNIWLYSFEQFMVIVPHLFMGTSLFSGAITLGILIQVSNAFSQVRESFSILVRNWTTITELRSIHKRLKEFEYNINYKR